MTSRAAERAASASPPTAREAELLAVTLELLQQNGYERLTVDAVAAAAKASKATVYRRWPSKAELVLAAFIKGIGDAAPAPNTGTLRGDLLALGSAVCEQSARHASTISAVLPEMARNPALGDALQHDFVDQRRAVMTKVLGQAVARGELAAESISEELWDLLPGYLVFRNMIPGNPPTESTVEMLVDHVVLPSLERTTSSPS